MHISVKEAFSPEKLGKTCCVKGWIRTTRAQKNLAFVELNDGSQMQSLQLILDASVLSDFSILINDLAIGSAICAKGTLVENPNKKGVSELQVSSIDIIGTSSAEDYPLQKKRHSLEFLRSIAHLRGRTNALGAAFRIRNELQFATHEFFYKQGFFHVASPIITAADCEGLGELFRVSTLPPGADDFSKDFFEKEAFLAVSGQLNAEAYALSHSKVYTFGPTFRAENSNTSRHLAEFWMIEPEVAFADLNDNMDLAEAYLHALFKRALDNCERDLALFNQFIQPGLIERLENNLKPFERITYTEAIKILNASNEKFQFPHNWGDSLQSEHERYLCEKHFKGPCIVTDYPAEFKAFYMRQNDDGKTVAAMDVLVPHVGELIGGSQREERYDLLKAKIQASGLSEKELQWYLDLRRFGTCPHSGFGVGFERLVQYVTGLENIRDVIPFPRTPGNAQF